MRSRFTKQKIGDACRALAEFHVAAANKFTDGSQTGCQPSPGMQDRYRSALQLQVQLPHYRTALLRLPENQTRALCAEILDLAAPELQRLPSLMQPVLDQPLPLQPCIRDIWHQHVLFDGDQLTGIVDFGAMRVESVALDLARLLGSLALCHPDVWQMGMLAYESVRPLSSVEIRTMRCAAASSCVLSGLNWVRWLAAEQRMFEKMDLVQVRLCEIRDQLRSSLSFSLKKGE